MLSLSPTFAKRCTDALETVSRAPLAPIVSKETPRHLSALSPAIRSLPVDLQVAALCDMLADARQQMHAMQVQVDRAENEVDRSRAIIDRLVPFAPDSVLLSLC